jgi:hypothetical protein
LKKEFLCATFLTGPTKDGRITIPKLKLTILTKKKGNLDGYPEEVTMAFF